jgi:hypothetical protein
MAIDFKKTFETLKTKDNQPLTDVENGYVRMVENYMDSTIEKKLSTDSLEVWFDFHVVKFIINPVTNKPFESMTEARRQFLKRELLSRYENANWLIKTQLDDGLDGNMSGGDYLILKGKL